MNAMTFISLPTGGAQEWISARPSVSAPVGVRPAALNTPSAARTREDRARHLGDPA